MVLLWLNGLDLNMLIWLTCLRWIYAFSKHVIITVNVDSNSFPKVEAVALTALVPIKVGRQMIESFQFTKT